MDRLAIAGLLEERKIERLLMAYASALDNRDWATLDDVFTSGATADYGSFGRPGSRAEIVAMIREALARCGPTQHLLGNMRIETEGGEASSICSLQSIHAGLGQYRTETLTIWGEYRDRLELRPEGWRIAHREFKVTHACGDIGLAD
ncbi:MAG: nuclear transport factor 2 family protein [Azonexus sp.]|jgi:3-phenylpropionate/cinnamic acid dioxygenase small subunit|nr:nuclear transport factor 2 family protein [Azonexus sp.]